MKYIILILIIGLNSLAAKAQFPVYTADSIVARDGKKLAIDIYLPDTTGGKTYPTILIQTPYNKAWYRLGLPLGYGAGNDTSSFAFVIMDWRCYYGSAAACVASPDKGKDGYDAVEWIAGQAWSNGRVGTWGPSALGRVQFMTAKENPPHLTCIAPVVAGPQYEYQEYFPGGCARDEYIEQLDGLGFGMSPILYANPYYNTLWSFAEPLNNYPSAIHVPTLMIGGWYDHNTRVMVEFFDTLSKYGDPTVRDEHKLLMGPWVHGGHGTAQVGTAAQGELYYPAADGWNDSMALRFFRYYLLDEANGWDLEAKTTFFQMGEDSWQSCDYWPTNDVNEVSLYLHPSGNLLTDIPTTAHDSISFTYDPRDPSPTIGGTTLRADLDQGPYDQAPLVESRSDILVFTTPVLSADVVMKGSPSVHLFVSSDRLDTDFAVRITDVYPDGRSMLLMDGIRRGRFRNGNNYASTDTSFLQTGRVYEIDVLLPPSSITFIAGHRIRLDITSSIFPKYNNNMNDGDSMYVTGDTLIATNTVFFDQSRPSCLIIPVVDYPSAIGDKSNEGMNVFPNPFEDRFHLVLPDNWINTSVQIKIFSQDGKLIFTYNGTYYAGMEIFPGKIGNGNYLLQVNGKSGPQYINISRQ